MASDDRYFWCEDGFVCDRTKEAAESTADNPLYEEVEPVEELNRLARMLYWAWCMFDCENPMRFRTEDDYLAELKAGDAPDHKEASDGTRTLDMTCSRVQLTVYATDDGMCFISETDAEVDFWAPDDVTVTTHAEAGAYRVGGSYVVTARRVACEETRDGKWSKRWTELRFVSAKEADGGE